MRPIIRGMVHYGALLDPAYDIEDFLLMNEALDVMAENERRARGGK